MKQSNLITRKILARICFVPVVTTRVFSLCIILFFALGCTTEIEEPNPEIKDPPVTFIKMLYVPELLPYQSVSLGGSSFPGVVEDYQMFFNNISVPIEKVSPDSIKILVPLEAEEGMKDVTLLYKGEEFFIGTVEILQWDNVLPSNLSFFEIVENDEYPIHIMDSAHNVILPHFNGGILDKILVNGYEGSNYIIELNDIGLPSLVYNETVSIMMDGYNLEKGTVNIAKFESEDFDNAGYKYEIELKKEDLDALLNIRATMNGRVSVNGRVNSAALDQALEVVGTVFGLTGCIISAATLTPPFTVAGVFLTSLTCGSAGYSAYKLLNPDGGHVVVDHVNAVHGIKMGLIDCLSLAAKPKNAAELYEGMYGCYSLAIEAGRGVNTIFDDYKANEEKRRNLEKLRATLNSGFGDIKITLDWNTQADIDLWVIEPSGHKIYYDSRTSASEGQLDLDDTDGFGPENVYWPTNKAPFGDYQVLVHFYGSESDPQTTFRVVINNFGKSKTFTGTLSYNEVETVATFKAGANWTGGRISTSAKNIKVVRKTSLPLKK